MAKRVRREVILFIAISTLLNCQFIYSTSSVLISAPFDNFRIECPQSSGAQRLSIRMIESQGLKRQDAVYALSCNHIEELYPWSGIPAEIREIEREDCRYSAPFDPIIENSVGFTCRNREYLTGIARLSDTRIQVECCRMRTRDEISCSEREFLKPFGPDSRTEIEFNAKLINAISIDGHNVRVRFCDLAPRDYEMIKADVRTTTPTPSTTTKTMTSMTTPIETTTQFEEELITENLAVILQPKRIIKISQKSSLSQKGNWSTQYPNSSSADTTTIPQPNTDNDIVADDDTNEIRSSSDRAALDKNEVPLRDLSHVQQQQQQQKQELSELAETQKIIQKQITGDVKSPNLASNSQKKSDENTEIISSAVSADESLSTLSTEIPSTTTSADPLENSDGKQASSSDFVSPLLTTVAADTVASRAEHLTTVVSDVTTTSPSSSATSPKNDNSLSVNIQPVDEGRDENTFKSSNGSLLDEFKRKLPKEPLPIVGYNNKHSEIDQKHTEKEDEFMLSTAADFMKEIDTGATQTTLSTAGQTELDAATTTQPASSTATNAAEGGATTAAFGNNTEEISLGTQPNSISNPTDISTTAASAVNEFENGTNEEKSTPSETRESHNSYIRHHHESSEKHDTTNFVKNTTDATGSIEVSAAERVKEREFPTEKDYENVDEATAELMRSIAGMIEARRDAKNILKRVKAAGLPQTRKTKAESEEFAENMLRELEEKDGIDKTSAKSPGLSSDLLRQSMEALAEVSRVGAEGDDTQYDDEGTSLAAIGNGEPKQTIAPYFTKDPTLKIENIEISTLAVTKGTSSVISSSTSSSLSSLSDEGIEKVISLPPGRNRHSKNFGKNALRNKDSGREINNESHNVIGESTDGETKTMPSNIMMTNTQPKNTPRITVSSDAEAENLVPMTANFGAKSTNEKQSESSVKTEKKNKVVALAPFAAFPSPPPPTQNRTKTSPRSLAQWKLASDQHASTPPSAQNTPAHQQQQQKQRKASRTLVDNENDSEHGTKANNIINEDLVDATEKISTRFPPTTRIPHHKRKLLTTQWSSAEDEEFESTPAPARSVSARVKVPAKRPAEGRQRAASHSRGASTANDGPNGPYVDEETDESPFDFGLKHLPNYHHRRRQEEALAAAASVAASKESDDALEAEIANYERELQRKRERGSEAQGEGEGNSESISASSRGRSRFEKAEPRFDKHGPFDLSAEIRRSPAHRGSDAVSLYEIRQELLERRLMQQSQRRQADIAKSISPPIFEEDVLARESQEFIEADSIIRADNNRQQQGAEQHQDKSFHNKPHSTTIDDKSGKFEKASNAARVSELLPPRDGTRQFSPRDNKPVEMPDIIVYDTVDYKNLPWIVKDGEKHRSRPNVIVNDLMPMETNENNAAMNRLPSTERIDFETSTDPMTTATHEIHDQNEMSTAVFVAEPPYHTENQEGYDHPKSENMDVAATASNAESLEKSLNDYSESTESTQPTTTTVPSTTTTVAEETYWTRRTTLENVATSPPYNPAKFYYVPQRKRKLPFFKEKVLTFCSKDTAIRDANNLIIACGGDDGIWQPNRCPPSTACFVAPDSTYYICCPVASH